MAIATFDTSITASKLKVILASVNDKHLTVKVDGKAFVSANNWIEQQPSVPIVGPTPFPTVIDRPTTSPTRAPTWLHSRKIGNSGSDEPEAGFAWFVPVPL